MVYSALESSGQLLVYPGSICVIHTPFACRNLRHLGILALLLEGWGGGTSLPAFSLTFSSLVPGPFVELRRHLDILVLVFRGFQTSFSCCQQWVPPAICSHEDYESRNFGSLPWGGGHVRSFSVPVLMAITFAFALLGVPPWEVSRLLALILDPVDRARCGPYAEGPSPFV